MAMRAFTFSVLPSKLSTVPRMRTRLLGACAAAAVASSAAARNVVVRINGILLCAVTSRDLALQADIDARA